MARITVQDFNLAKRNNPKKHDEIKAEFFSFSVGNEKLFQIDTFGRSTRQNKDKVSQSIQFDKETAIFLIEQLKTTFNIK